MSFDPQTGKPVAAASGFDPNTGQPVTAAIVAAGAPAPVVAAQVLALNVEVILTYMYPYIFH
jgi:hypothetical protein